MAMAERGPLRTVLGTAFTRAGEEEIALSRDVLLKPTWVLGRSGRGKSSLLFNIALRLMRNGEGLGVIDPHGHLSNDLN
jgi:hypothetical protein